MFGNNTFGHYMHINSNPQGFGKSGHGTSSFGSSGKEHGDSHAFGSAGFGSGQPAPDPNGMLYHAFDGQHYGHTGILRQNSLLGEMTQSKQERAKGAKPWVFSSFSYPVGQHGDGVFSSLYEKPLEKPKLVKQETVIINGIERAKRAPSFTSDPEKMRGKTIHDFDLPPRRPPRIRKSISIVDDLTQPQNMDVAASFVKRHQSLYAEKERKKSTHRKHSFTLPRFGKHRKSSKSKDPSTEPDSESASMAGTFPRSRSDTGISQKSAPLLMQGQITPPLTDKQNTPENVPSKTDSQTPSDADEHLILSLMNPEVADEVFDPEEYPRESLTEESENQQPLSLKRSQSVEPSKMTREKSPLPLAQKEKFPVEFPLSKSPQETSVEKSAKHKSLPQDKLKIQVPEAQKRPLKESPPRNKSPIQLTKPEKGTAQQYTPTNRSPVHSVVDDRSPTHQHPHSNRLPVHSAVADRSPTQPSSPIDRSPIQSPTLVSKRVHDMRSREPFNSSNNSNQLSPQPVHAQKASKSPTRNPALLALIPAVTQKYAYKTDGRPLSNADTNDSDTSEAYFSANQSQHSSPIPSMADTSPVRKRTVRKTRNACSDGEDTSSANDTPPRSSFRDSCPRWYKPTYHDKTNTEKYLHSRSNEDIHDSETLKIRHRDPYPEMKGRPNITTQYNNTPFQTNINMVVDDYEEPVMQNRVFVMRNYAPVIKTEPNIKNYSNEHLTVDSSESGYGTSHLPTSPKNYDPYKVSQFVNSLPNYPDIDERRSVNSQEEAVLNGSETDSDYEGEHFSQLYYPPENLDLNGVNCNSGSDSENESIKTSDTNSKLEVMKILESPTEVRVRVNNSMKEKPKEKANAQFKDGEPKVIEKIRKVSNSSQTELLKLPMHPKDEDSTDYALVKSVDKKDVEVQCMVITQEPNAKAETKLLTPSTDRQTSFAGALIEKFSFRREYSSFYQTKTTNCIDAFLHFLNLILFLSSSGIIGIGIWLHLKDFNINDITVILGDNLLQVITYVAIGGAGVTLLAACCLCCGIRSDKSGLGFYAFVLVAAVITFATAAVLSTIFSDKLQGVEFKVNFKDRLVSMYGIELQNGVENVLFTSAWNEMQSSFECCGGEGKENDTESWAIYRKSEWYLQNPDKGVIFVPESCCKKNSNIKICQGGDTTLLGPPRFGPPRSSVYPTMNPNLNTDGCYQAFSHYLATMSTYLAVTCGSLAGLYFLTVMLTWVFCFKKSQDLNEDSVVDQFYDIEDEVYACESISDKDLDIKDEDAKLLNSNPPSRKTLNLTLNCNVNQRELGNINPAVKHCAPQECESVYKAMNSQDSIDSGGSSEESDTDSESDYSSNPASPTEVEDRRNLWLSSACTAGHLLSIAIEEEDSNFEDSDVENERVKA